MLLHAPGHSSTQPAYLCYACILVARSLACPCAEAMQAICSPPRGCQLAYADLQALPLGSKQAGYDLFKQKAMAERVRAQREEAANVVHGSRPEGPQHRNMLQKLLGGGHSGCSWGGCGQQCLSGGSCFMAC